MQIINLYKYIRPDGGITITPMEPENIEYTDSGLRLVADEGKMLTTDGKNLISCIDVEILDGWYEVEAPMEGKSVRRWIR